MSKRTKLILFAVIAVIELLLLLYIRGSYRSTMLEGKEFETPCSVVFHGNFYDRNYLHVDIPVSEAPWEGDTIPEQGQEVYLVIFKDSKGLMGVDHAQADKPDGSDYIRVRVNAIEDGRIHFEFPADRMYMAPETLARLPIVELSERVQVRNGSGGSESQMKNKLTAILHIKDGRAAIYKVLANGAPIEQTYNTVGKNVEIHYGTSAGDEDQVIENPGAGTGEAKQ